MKNFSKFFKNIDEDNIDDTFMYVFSICFLILAAISFIAGLLGHTHQFFMASLAIVMFFVCKPSNRKKNE